MALKVLIVEDEEILALDLSEQVEEAGHVVLSTAADLPQAIAAASADRPDIALMDIRLARGSNGLDVARILRDRWNVPCIFLSANLDPDTRARAMAMNPLGFINKPYNPRAVAEALAAAVLVLIAKP